MLFTLFALGASCAQAQAVTYRFDLGAQALADSLRTLGQQTSRNIVFDPALVDGLRAPTLHADLTVKDAIELLLAGTKLSAREISPDTVLIELGAPRAPPSDEIAPSIETVNVFGALDNEVSVASKSGQSLRETPKSVSVVTRERIEVQSLTSLLEVLTQTTGVTAVNYSSVDSYYLSRGFEIHTVQIDGGSPAYTGGFGSFLTPDTAAYDHIEVLRGVDGIFTGAGEPGGVINLVRKRALATPQVQVNVSAGRWNMGRAELDVTGAITDDDRLRGRVVAAYEGKDYFYERAESDKKLFFGTFEYDIAADTTLIAGASYERRKEHNYFVSGVMRYDDGRDLQLSRETAFNPDWSHWFSTTREAFARVEHKYGATGMLKLNLTRLEQDSENRQFLALGAVSSTTGTGPRAYMRGSDLSSAQDLLDLSASGTFNAFGLQHRYTVGADYAKVDAGGQKDIRATNYFDAVTGPAVDVFDFDPTIYAVPIEYVGTYYSELGPSQHGYYASLGLQLQKALRLTLAARYGEYRYRQVYQRGAPDGTLDTPISESHSVSRSIPSAALTWDLAEEWTAYVSYAETYQPQSVNLRAPLPGTALDPAAGSNYEVGLKGRVHGSLNAALAVYRLDRTGQAVADPAYPVLSGTEGGQCCFLPLGDITSEGFDAELSGHVAPGWQMLLGYTFTQTSRSGGASELASLLGYSPKHLLKAWSTWQLPGRLSRWSVSTGVVAQSRTHFDGLALDENAVARLYRFEEGSRAIWNASLQYRISEHWLVGIFGDNLADKRYYSVVGDARRNNIYGTPRSCVLTLRALW
ncbi:TonB-dependent siderophore receptor [Steroidobacter sp.]|uniref:TonB-dependent siderophore receptor n=1 Tax=Steroidobacter sp. TaxID=1978227 RepID=UPI001A505D79|nr:TonB-dependent receptor [Steroidobacter sp.]MBL8271587.1 TonB-dependent siderophore receptor [Steroidobacter sp.]